MSCFHKINTHTYTDTDIHIYNQINRLYKMLKIGFLVSKLDDWDIS